MISNSLKLQACAHLGCSIDQLDAIDWIETFSTSTNGLSPNLSANKSLIDSEVHGFRRVGEQTGIKHCEGEWQEWNGWFEDPWNSEQKSLIEESGIGSINP